MLARHIPPTTGVLDEASLADDDVLHRKKETTEGRDAVATTLPWKYHVQDRAALGVSQTPRESAVISSRRVCQFAIGEPH